MAKLIICSIIVSIFFAYHLCKSIMTDRFMEAIIYETGFIAFVLILAEFLHL